MRVALEDATALAGVSRAVSDAGGLVTALDVAEPIEGKMIVDLTCNASDDDHAELLKASVDSVDGGFEQFSVIVVRRAPREDDNHLALDGLSYVKGGNQSAGITDGARHAGEGGGVLESHSHGH